MLKRKWDETIPVHAEAVRNTRTAMGLGNENEELKINNWKL